MKSNSNANCVLLHLFDGCEYVAAIQQAHNTIQQCKTYSFEGISRQLPLLYFMQKTPIKKQGRRLAASNGGNLQLVSKRNVATVLPTVDIRYDQYVHWPVHRDKKMRFWFCSTGNTKIAC